MNEVMNLKNLKKMSLKKILSIVSIVLLCFIVFSGCLGGKIDPSIQKDNIEQVKALLTDEFYYFDYDPELLFASGGVRIMTDSMSSIKRKRGEFSYVGYTIGYSLYPLTNDYHSASFSVKSMKNSNVDKELEYKHLVGDRIEKSIIYIDDIECIYVIDLQSAKARHIFFVIEDITYSFGMEYRSVVKFDKKEVFDNICGQMIKSRHKKI